jgi:hypothetical protein
MSRLQLIDVGDRGVKFINDRLQVWFNLVPDPENDGKNWYAGSTTSALLYDKEILDPKNADTPWLYMCHDREKRCMQIDQIQLYDSLGKGKLGQPAQLFSKPYRLIAKSGPVQPGSVQPGFIEITVASSPFECIYPVGGGMRRLECELHRVIRLAAEASYLDEELSIHVKSGAEPGTESVAPCFAVCYYAHINAGEKWGLLVLSSEDAHAVVAGGNWARPPGGVLSYGLVCDARIEDLRWDSSSVSVLLSPRKSLGCRHLFNRYDELSTALDAASHETLARQVA